MGFTSRIGRIYATFFLFLLAACSLAVIGLYASTITLENEINNIGLGGLAYGYDPPTVNLSKEVPAAIAISSLNFIFAFVFFFLILSQWANAAVVISIIILLIFAWLGILGYLIHNYILKGGHYWDFLTGCSTNRVDYGYDIRADFYSKSCGYIRVQFAAMIIIGLSVLILGILFIISISVCITERRKSPRISQ